MKKRQAPLYSNFFRGKGNDDDDGFGDRVVLGGGACLAFSFFRYCKEVMILYQISMFFT